MALTTGFQNGVGRIWMDNVQCRGTERSLFNCPQNPLGSHDCVHSEDAGVRCPTGKESEADILVFPTHEKTMRQ